MAAPSDPLPAASAKEATPSRGSHEATLVALGPNTAKTGPLADSLPNFGPVSNVGQTGKSPICSPNQSHRVPPF